MGSLILCRGKRAKKPYYIESISKRVYTVEELCFYFRNYAHLFEASKEAEEEGLAVAEWLLDELDMKKEAEEIKRLAASHKSMQEWILSLFRSTHYLTKAEQAEYVQKLKKLCDLTPFERRKKQADHLVESRKYAKAIWAYQGLLQEEGEEKESVEAEIYHNMGVAFARMFYFKESCDYFLKAFLKTPKKESLRQYKLAARLCEDEIVEDEFVKEFPGAASMDVQIYEEMKQLEGSAEYEDGIGEIEKLKQLKNEGKIVKMEQKEKEIMQKWQDECRAFMDIK